MIKNKILELHIQEYKINFDFSKFCSFVGSELIMHVEKNNKNTSFMCNIIFDNNGNNYNELNLNINYKEPAFSNGKINSRKKDKTSEREILISRTIDKSVRPLLINLNKCNMTINIVLLNTEHHIDFLSFATIATMFCLKKIYNINANILKFSILNKQLILFPNNAILQKSSGSVHLICNSQQIFFIDVELNNLSNVKLISYIKSYEELIQYMEKKLNSIKSMLKIPVLESNPKAVKNKKINNNFNAEMISEKFKLNNIEIQKTISEHLAINKMRLDKRKLNEIRPITISRPVKANSSMFIFSRGDTQVLSDFNYCNDKINIGDTIREEQNIIVNYNFPGFCTGNLHDKKFSKRELSHGDLIRAAFQKVSNPNINIRLHAEVLSSNGSSSMASISALSCSLFQKGVIADVISGISIGLWRSKKKEVLFADMTANEDNFSEMDFKIAGTNKGINAIRADFKSYISLLSLPKILKLGLKIIKDINGMIIKEIDISEKSQNFNINVKKLGLFIGTSGKHIKEIALKTNCVIKTFQDGLIIVNGKDLELFQKLVKPFLVDVLKKRDKIALVVKENTETNIVSTVLGNINLEKKYSLLKNNIIELTLINVEKLEFEITNIVV